MTSGGNTFITITHKTGGRKQTTIKSINRDWHRLPLSQILPNPAQPVNLSKPSSIQPHSVGTSYSSYYFTIFTMTTTSTTHDQKSTKSNLQHTLLASSLNSIHSYSSLGNLILSTNQLSQLAINFYLWLSPLPNQILMQTMDSKKIKKIN